MTDHGASVPDRAGGSSTPSPAVSAKGAHPSRARLQAMVSLGMAERVRAAPDSEFGGGWLAKPIKEGMIKGFEEHAYSLCPDLKPKGNHPFPNKSQRVRAGKGRKGNHPQLWEMIVGGAIGLGLVGWFFIAQPMMRNHAECGRVTLCKGPSHE